MLTISCYTFHPLAVRFVRLWKNVQVVSDWLVFFLSMLCCQCGQLMPLSDCSSITEDQQFAMVDPGRASGEPLLPQHVVIDFSPQPQDALVETRCIQLLDLIKSQPEFNKMLITPEEKSFPENSPNVPIHKRSPQTSAGDGVTFPAMKAIQHIQDRGAVTAVFQTAISKHCSRR